MFASVIFTCYDQSGWLERTLWGLSAPKYRVFETIATCDGPGPQTRGVARLRPREAIARNRSIRAQVRKHRVTHTQCGIEQAGQQPAGT